MFHKSKRSKKSNDGNSEQESGSEFMLNGNYYIPNPTKLPKLHKAAFQGNVEKIHSYREKGSIKVNDLDKHDRSALHYAAHAGHKKCISALLEFKKVEINPRDKAGQTPLFKAIQSNSPDCVKALIVGKNGIKAEVNVKDDEGCYPVHIAAQMKNPTLLEYIIKSQQANLNVVDANGCTALFLASAHGRLENVKLLAHTGADTNKIAKDGRSPILHALIMKHFQVVEFLASRPDINVLSLDSHGKTVVDYALDMDDIDESVINALKEAMDRQGQELENMRPGKIQSDAKVGDPEPQPGPSRLCMSSSSSSESEDEPVMDLTCPKKMQCDSPTDHDDEDASSASSVSSVFSCSSATSTSVQSLDDVSIQSLDNCTPVIAFDAGSLESLNEKSTPTVTLPAKKSLNKRLTLPYKSTYEAQTKHVSCKASWEDYDELEALQKKNQQMQEELRFANEAVENLEQDKELQKQRCETSDRNKGGAWAEETQLKAKLAASEQQIKEKDRKIQDLEVEITNAQAEIMLLKGDKEKISKRKKAIKFKMDQDELDSYKQQVIALEETISSLRSENKKLNEKVELTEMAAKARDQFSDDVTTLNERIDSLEIEVGEKSTEIEKMESQIEMKDVKIGMLKGKMQKCTELNERITELEEERNDLLDAKASLEDEVDQLKEQVVSGPSRMNEHPQEKTESLLKQLEVCEKENISLKETIKSITDDVTILNKIIDSLEIEVDEKKKEIEKMENQIEMKDVKIGMLEGKMQKCTELNERITELEEERNDLLDAKASLEDEVDKLKEQVARAPKRKTEHPQENTESLLKQLEICEKENVSLKERIKSITDDNVVDRLCTDSRKLQEKNAQMNHTLNTFKLEAERYKAQCDSSMDDFKKTYRVLEMENYTLATRNQTLENAKATLESKITHLELERREFQKLVGEKEKDLEVARDKLKEMKDKLKSEVSRKNMEEQLQLENRDLKYQISDVKNSSARQRKEFNEREKCLKEMDEVKEKEIKNVKDELKNKIQTYETELQKIRDQLGKEKERNEGRDQSSLEFVNKMNEFEFENKKLLSVVEDLEKSLAQFEKEKKQLLKNERQLTIDNNNLTRNLKTFQEKCQSLEEQTKSLHANEKELMEAMKEKEIEFKVKVAEMEETIIRGKEEFSKCENSLNEKIKERERDIEESKALLKTKAELYQKEFLEIKNLLERTKESKCREELMKVELKGKVKKYERELQDIKDQFRRNKESAAGKGQSHVEIINKVNNIEFENEKLFSVIEDVEKSLAQVGKEKRQLSDKERQLLIDNKSLARSLKNYKQKYHSLETEMQHFRENEKKLVETIKEKDIEFKIQISEMEQTIILVREEFDKIENSLNENIRKRGKDAEVGRILFKEKAELYEKKFQEIKRLLEKTKENKYRKEQLKVELEDKMQTYEKKLQEVKDQLEKSKESITDKGQSYVDLVNKANNVEFEHERLLSIIQDLENSITQLEEERRQLSQKERQATINNESLARSLENFEKKCYSLENQADHLRANEKKLLETIKNQEMQLKEARDHYKKRETETESCDFYDNVEHQLQLTNKDDRSHILKMKQAEAGQEIEFNKGDKHSEDKTKETELESERINRQRENETEITDNEWHKFQSKLDKVREDRLSKKQSEKAHEQTEKMTSLEFEHEKLLSLIEDMEKTIGQLEKDKRAISQSETQLIITSESLARSLKKCEKKCDSLEIESGTLHTNEKKMKEKIKELEDQLEKARGKFEGIENNTRSLEFSENKMKQFESENNDLKSQLSRMKEKFKEQEKELKRTEAYFKNKKLTHEMDSQEQEKSNKCDKYNFKKEHELAEKMNGVQFENEKLLSVVEDMEKSVSQVEKEKNKLSKSENQLTISNGSLTRNLKKCEKKCNWLEAERKSLRANEKKLQETCKEQEEQLKNIHEKCKLLEKELEQTCASMEAFSKEKQNLLDAINNIKCDNKKLSNVIQKLENDNFIMAKRVQGSDEFPSTQGFRLKGELLKNDREMINQNTQAKTGFDLLKTEVLHEHVSNVNDCNAGLGKQLEEAKELVAKMTYSDSSLAIRSNHTASGDETDGPRLSQEEIDTGKDVTEKGAVAKYQEEIVVLTHYMDALVRQNEDLNRRMSTKSLNDELKEKFALNSTDLKQKISCLQAELKIVREDNESIRHKLKFLKLKEELKGRFAIQCEELYKKLATFQGYLKDAEYENCHMKDKLRDLVLEKSSQQNMKENFEKKLDNLKQSKLSLQIKIDDLIDENRSISKNLKQACANQEVHAVVIKKYEHIKKSVPSLATFFEEMKDEVMRIENECEERESGYLNEIENLKEQLGEAKQEFQSELSKNQESVDREKNKLRKLAVKYNSLKKHLENCKGESKSLENTFRILNGENDCLREKNIKAEKKSKESLEIPQGQTKLNDKTFFMADDLQKTGSAYSSLSKEQEEGRNKSQSLESKVQIPSKAVDRPREEKSKLEQTKKELLRKFQMHLNCTQENDDLQHLATQYDSLLEDFEAYKIHCQSFESKEKMLKSKIFLLREENVKLVQNNKELSERLQMQAKSAEKNDTKQQRVAMQIDSYLQELEASKIHCQSLKNREKMLDEEISCLREKNAELEQGNKDLSEKLQMQVKYTEESDTQQRCLAVQNDSLLKDLEALKSQCQSLKNREKMLDEELDCLREKNTELEQGNKDVSDRLQMQVKWNDQNVSVVQDLQKIKAENQLLAETEKRLQLEIKHLQEQVCQLETDKRRLLDRNEELLTMDQKSSVCEGNDEQIDTNVKIATLEDTVLELERRNLFLKDKLRLANEGSVGFMRQKESINLGATVDFGEWKWNNSEDYSDGMQTDLAVYKLKTASLERDLKHAKEEIQRLEASLEKKVEEFEDEKNAHEKQLQCYKEELERNSSSRITQEVEEIKRKFTYLKSDLIEKDEDLEKAKEIIKELTDQLDNQNARREEWRAQVLEEGQKQTQILEENLQRTREFSDKKIVQLLDEVNSLRSKCNKMKQENFALEAKNKALIKDKEEYPSRLSWRSERPSSFREGKLDAYAPVKDDNKESSPYQVILNKHLNFDLELERRKKEFEDFLEQYGKRIDKNAEEIRATGEAAQRIREKILDPEILEHIRKVEQLSASLRV